MAINKNIEISTPYYSHVKKYKTVYEPAEDTFLLLDALQEDRDAITKRRPLQVLEVGCGSGVVIAFLSKIIGPGASYMCTDVNPQATKCCHETARENNLVVETVVADLIFGLLPRMRHQVDILLFNPPYVVTASEEICNIGLSSSWAGGANGREVMDRLFDLVPELLSQTGIFYLVVIEENKPQEIKMKFQNWGFQQCIIAQRRSGPEFLSVIKIWRSTEVDLKISKIL